jgi:arylsulfatase A-like enzyme
MKAAPQPFIVRWPGVTTGVHARFDDSRRSLSDVPGAGRAPPPSTLDGESRALFRDPEAKLKRDAIFQHFPGYLGAGAGQWRTTPVSLIHSGDWKLMEFLEDGRLELYNLREDVGETKNLAIAMPDTKELHARLVAWRAEVNAPMPTRTMAPAPGQSESQGQEQGQGESRVGWLLQRATMRSAISCLPCCCLAVRRRANPAVRTRSRLQR